MCRSVTLVPVWFPATRFCRNKFIWGPFNAATSTTCWKIGVAFLAGTLTFLLGWFLSADQSEYSSSTVSKMAVLTTHSNQCSLSEHGETRLSLLSEISASHGGEYENGCLLDSGFIALMMEAASTSETSANFYHTTQRNNPEDSHLQGCPCAKARSLEAKRGHGDKEPRSLKLGSRRRYQLHVPASITQRWCSLHRKLSGVQSRVSFVL
jgi:hypothetical protein